MKMSLNSPAKYLYDLYGNTIKDISKGKSQRFYKLYDHTSKDICTISYVYIYVYIYEHIYMHIYMKTDIIKVQF